MSPNFTQRNKKGATTLALVLVIAFCGILPLGLLGFELVRFFVIQEQLRNITDSAALAGTAAMASAPSAPATFPAPNQSHLWTYEDREAVAVSVAAFTFTQNTILENQFGLPAGSPVLSYTDAQGLTVPVTAAASPPGNCTVNIDPSPPAYASPPAYSVVLNIVLYFTNTLGVTSQVAMGVPATSIQVQAYYSDKPVFLGTQTGWNNFVNNMNSKFTVSAISNGGLPQIDLLLAFDTSGSMDDQTYVAFVNRYWSGNPKIPGTPAADKMIWSVQKADTLFNCINPPPIGSGLNVFFPQNLDYASWTQQTDPEGFQVGNITPLLFTETSGYPSNAAISAQTNGLRGNTTVASTGGAIMPEQALPPGNTGAGGNLGNHNINNGPSGTLNPRNPINGGTRAGSAYAAGAIPPIFTDMVVLPNGVKAGAGVNLGIAGGTTALGTAATVKNGASTFTFTTVAELVEASRGNLESAAALTSATMNTYTNTLLGSTAQAGSYNAYWLWVLQQAQPVTTAEAAAYDFFQTMHLSADTHFGLETFAGTEASLAGGGTGTSGSGATETTVALPNISSFWNPGGAYTSQFPFPCIAESQAADNYAAITNNFLPPPLTSFTAPVTAASIPLQPTSQTDIADALTVSTAIMTDNTKTRATARKAVILFTDGVPTGDDANGASFHETEGYNDAINAAKAAGATSPPLPIYTIGLATNPAIVPLENALLGDGLSPGFPNPPYPKGIAWDSDANVARYYNVTNPQNLEEAFQTIARSLCVIVQ